MSFSDFTKNENKSIIWGLLQEGGVFNDIPNTYFENIKKLFETSIVSMKPDFDVFFDKNDEGDDDYEKKASEMIVNSNKGVIKKMINELGKFKKPLQQQNTQKQQQQQQHQVPPSNVLPIPPRFDMNSDSRATIPGGKKQKIEEIYRADDLQNHRMSELESRLKEKQEEMDTMLNNKKPTSIDFSDTKLNDNKLASDEMEQLLAQALSSRQRELEHLTMNTTKDNSKNAEEWITGSNDPVANALNASIAIKRSHDIKRPTEQNYTVSKKNVSFNEENNEEILYDKGSINHTNNDTNNDSTTSGDIMNNNGNGNHNGNDNSNSNDNESNNGNLFFLSKLKIKSPNSGNRNESSVDSIPLDDFMTDYDDDGQSEDNNVQLFVNDTTRDTRDAREYVKLEERINKIQTYVESIKETQDKILELLQSK
jgi:hypothetical protein